MNCIICALSSTSEINFAGEKLTLCNSWQCWYCHFKQSQSYLLQAYVKKFQFLTYHSENSTASSMTLSLPSKKIGSYVAQIPETPYSSFQPIKRSESKLDVHSGHKDSELLPTKHPKDVNTQKPPQKNPKFSKFIPASILSQSKASANIPATDANLVPRKRGRPRKYPIEFSLSSIKTPKPREAPGIPMPSSLHSSILSTSKQPSSAFKLYVNIPYSPAEVEKVLRYYLTRINPRLSSKYIIFLLNLWSSDIDYKTPQSLKTLKQDFEAFFDAMNKQERTEPKKRISLWLRQNAAIIKKLKSELSPQDLSSPESQCDSGDNPSSSSTESKFHNDSDYKLPEDDVMVVSYEGEKHFNCKFEENGKIYDLEASSV